VTGARGIDVRLGRLFAEPSGNAVVIALDHGLFMGRVPGLQQPAHVAASLFESGADAIQCAPGLAPAVADLVVGKRHRSYLHRLDSTNIWRDGSLARSPGFWTPVSSPLEAVRNGADIAVCFLFAGWTDDSLEAANLRQIGNWARECGDLGMPLMIEPLPIPPAVQNENDPAVVGSLCRMAFELGANAIKCNYTGDAESFARIVGDVPVPVLMRGGPRTDSDAAYLTMVHDAISAGARGVVVGRNVFQAANPSDVIRELRSIVHGENRPSA
jgi:fructose-bisphosphate aldolase, class I